ncbi:CYTH and CHAD domain-containing protein [Kitasatospora sp. NBC_01250]|uniref:CYTH and CHAD domain-containing protein n=1 Tax=Kitasatospora sp. NBC_01250 TaxID=2903571 RepID=UPI002E2EF95E|nr:CYTH and CHAD domain-containing protein [Kitasatospora sp. NBC_01250]
MATVHREDQSFFEGAAGRRLRSRGLPGVAAVEAAPPQHLVDVYYDTADLRLLRRGGTLRCRTSGGEPGWRLTVPGADGEPREITVPLDAGAPGAVPARLAVLVRARTRGRELVAVARLRTVRSRVLLLDRRGRTLAELLGERVSAKALPKGRLAGGRRTWARTGLTLVAGGDELRAAVARVLRGQGLRPAATGAEGAEGAGGAGGAERAGLAELARLLRAESGGEGGGGGGGATAAALAAYLRRHTERLVALDLAVRLDEPDAVHQMRISQRRLRSALTAHRGLLRRRRTDRLGEELRWLGGLLGRARDAEVTGARLAAQAAELTAPADDQELRALLERWFSHRYRQAHTEVLAVLDGPRYRRLLDSLERFAERPPLREQAATGRSVARRTLRRECRRTGRRLRTAFAQSPGDRRDEAVHQARKAAKRARYAAECLYPALGARGRRLADDLKAIQQPLGRYQDAVVAEQTILLVAAEARRLGQDTFGYGVLYGAQRDHAEADLAAAGRAWASVGRG